MRLARGALILLLAAPLLAGQLPPGSVIGLLGAASPEAYADRLVAIRQGLKDAGYVEDQNLTIEYRWAEGRYDRLPATATPRPTADEVLQ